MNLGLKNKVALVTGGSSGIGLSIARRFLEAGARVFICGRDEHRLGEALDELQQYGDARGKVAHVDDPASAPELIDDVIRTFDALDIVISNAGTHLQGSIEDVDSAQVLSHFQTKVLGPWELARSALPHLKNSQAGRFVMIVGQAGKVPGRNIIASGVINAAQHALVKSLSDDFGQYGILVNAVCPSRIHSPLTDSLTLNEELYLGRSLEQQESGWGKMVPLGRWGTPDDIANAVLFMASERAGFICGSNIDVDGGYQRMYL